MFYTFKEFAETNIFFCPIHKIKKVGLNLLQRYIIAIASGFNMTYDKNDDLQMFKRPYIAMTMITNGHPNLNF